jgi:hypothetical protein
MKHVAPIRGIGRELLAVAAIALIGFVYLGSNWETRTPSVALGRVMRFGLVEQKGYGQIGSVLRAQVALPDIRLSLFRSPREVVLRSVQGFPLFVV